MCPMPPKSLPGPRLATLLLVVALAFSLLFLFTPGALTAQSALNTPPGPATPNLGTPAVSLPALGIPNGSNPSNGPVRIKPHPNARAAKLLPVQTPSYALSGSAGPPQASSNGPIQKRSIDLILPFPDSVTLKPPQASPPPLPTPAPTRAGDAAGNNPALAVIPSLDAGQTVSFQDPPVELHLTFADGPGWYRMFIMDANQQWVRKILDQKVLANGDGWASWDGMDEQGRIGPRGRYYAVLFKGDKALKGIPLVWMAPAK